MEQCIDPKYLPFSEQQLHACLAKPSGGRKSQTNGSAEKEPARIGVHYYTTGALEYQKYRANPMDFSSIAKSRAIRQIEKDERFWTAAALMAYKHSASPGTNWSKLFERCFGAAPSTGSFTSWLDAISENPVLLLEAPLPSPRIYSDWLHGAIRERQIIPYVLDAAPANREVRLEGFTHADAIVINPSTRFAVVFEAKVLSDISTDITFDCMRNQIARTIDVMLDPSDGTEHTADALAQRNPELTYFALLTPRLFQKNPWSRLYGRAIREYQQMPEALARDLPHRSGLDSASVSRRIGWITWEDCNEILPGACRWL